MRRHPRRVAAAVATALSTTALTAFGIAPLAPDAAELPQSMVTEEIQPEGLQQQIDTLAQTAFQLNRTGLTRANEGADNLLRRLGVADPAAAAFIRLDAQARRLIDGKAGKMLQLRTERDGTLLELVARFPALDEHQQATHFSRLTLQRKNGRFVSTLDTAPLVAQLRLGSGKIRGDMWDAVDEAHLPEAVAEQMIEIFSGDIDFHHELKRGDTFAVVYEGLTADGLPITWNEGMGRIVAAEFVNDGQRFQAVWYADPASDKGAYFGFDGKARRRAFLANPVEFSRITSGFGMREHPVLEVRKEHKGIDYAAPTGTSVQSVGKGVVEFTGRSGGYGNMIRVDHGGGRQTVYAHLSSIGVKVGQRVEQGQKIGAVGATGMATGPHLHFEFRVGGEFQDPQKVARATETLTLDQAARPRFMRMAANVRGQLEAASTLQRFRGDAE